MLKLKIRAKNDVLDPVQSRKIDLRRKEMFRCLSSLVIPHWDEQTTHQNILMENHIIVSNIIYS